MLTITHHALSQELIDEEWLFGLRATFGDSYHICSELFLELSSPFSPSTLVAEYTCNKGTDRCQSASSLAIVPRPQATITSGHSTPSSKQPLQSTPSTYKRLGNKSSAV